MFWGNAQILMKTFLQAEMETHFKLFIIQISKNYIAINIKRRMLNLTFSKYSLWILSVWCLVLTLSNNFSEDDPISSPGEQLEKLKVPTIINLKRADTTISFIVLIR